MNRTRKLYGYIEDPDEKAWHLYARAEKISVYTNDLQAIFPLDTPSPGMFPKEGIIH